jgi:hypothetical protein
LLISLKSGHRIVVAHAELKIIHYFSLTSGWKEFTLSCSRRAEKNSLYFAHDGLKIIQSISLTTGWK